VALSPPPSGPYQRHCGRMAPAGAERYEVVRLRITEAGRRALHEIGAKQMLTFDPSFHSDGVLGCVLWADETVMGRVRFDIGSRILETCYTAAMQCMMLPT
jgi:hypothetical protein